MPRLLIGMVIVLLTAALGAAAGTTYASRTGAPVPDVLGNLPQGDVFSEDGWIQPLLDAGFCVDFVYDQAATSFYRDGHFEAISDTYVIGREDPEPGTHRPAGSTVTVTVGGVPMGGPETDWNSAPTVCPSPGASHA